MRHTSKQPPLSPGDASTSTTLDSSQAERGKVLHGHSASTCPCGCSIFALRLTKNDRLPTDGGVQLATKPIALLRFFGRAKFIFQNLFQNLDAKPPSSHCCFPLSGTFGAQGQGEAWLLPGPPHEGGRQDTDQPGTLGLSLLICP